MLDYNTRLWCAIQIWVLLPSKFLLDYNQFEKIGNTVYVLLPSKFLLDYNRIAKVGTHRGVLLPSKFLLDYNSSIYFTMHNRVLLPSKFLLGWNYKERTYYVLMMFYKYSSSLKIKTDKSKRCRPSPKRERVLHLWYNYIKAFYFAEGSWTVFNQSKDSFRFLLWSVIMLLAKYYVWTAKLVCA